MIGLIVARSKIMLLVEMVRFLGKSKVSKIFKELTIGNIVVMGRKSYEEIGHPLPNRQNIIVSKTMKYEGENLITVSSLAEALALSDNSNIYIAGGYGVYKEAIPFVDVMYITEVDMNIEDGDVFFQSLM